MADPKVALDSGTIVPDFDRCGNCGADACETCSWDPALGWCCSNCGGCDGDE